MAGLAKVFQHSKRQPFQVGDQVYVTRWGLGQVMAFPNAKVKVFNADFGASGATIYADYSRVQRVG